MLQITQTLLWLADRNHYWFHTDKSETGEKNGRIICD